MIHLRLVREPSDGGHTFGALYVNDVWQCWTLEDVLREPRERPTGLASFAARDAWVRTWKLPGATAIPAGRYVVRLSLSNRFKRILPELIGVPGFVGIRIHAGNTEADTEGCLLLGQLRAEDRVLESRLALGAFLPRLEEAKRGKDPVVLDVENPPMRYLGSLSNGES